MPVAADIAALETRRTAIIAELNAMGVTKAGGLPDTSGPGSNTQHVAYRMSLYAELKEIRQALSDLGRQTPFEVTSEAH